MSQLVRFFKNGFLFLGLAFLALITFSLSISYTFMPLTVWETPEFYYNNWSFYILTGLLLLILFLLKKPLNAVSALKLFLGLASLTLLAGLYLIFNIMPDIRADAAAVHLIAGQFNQGDFSSITSPGQYLNMHIHQLGLVTFERLYYLFGQTSHVGFIFNLLSIISINFLQYRITDLLFKNSLVSKYTLLLSFLFLPHFFFILFVYGIIPGLFFVLLAVFLFLSYQQTEKLPYLIGGALAIGLAYLIRNNYIIPVIALLIISILQFIKTKNKRIALIPVSIVASLSLLSFGLKSYYTSQINQPLPAGIPKIAYINMGLTPSPDLPARSGWFNGYHFALFESQAFNTESAEKIAQEDLSNTISRLTQEPATALDLFYSKIRSTWTDPLFQSIWTGPSLQEHSELTTSQLIENIYSDTSAYRVLYAICFPILWIIYAFSLVGTFFQLRKKSEANSLMELYPILFFLGGLFFHLFWETKSQYVYYFVLLLIPIAMNGFVGLLGLLTNKPVSQQADSNLEQPEVPNRSHILPHLKKNLTLLTKKIKGISLPTMTIKEKEASPPLLPPSNKDKEATPKLLPHIKLVTSLAQKSIAGIALLILLLLVLTLFTSHAFMEATYAENPIFTPNPWFFYPLVALLFIVLWGLKQPLQQVSEWKVFLAIAILYFIIGNYLIGHVTSVIRDDAAHVFNTAKAFNAGDFSGLTTPGGYLFTYPHQLGLVTLERIYLIFSDSPRFGFTLNMLFIIGATFFQYRICQLLFNNRLLTNYFLILSFLFFPQFFYILFLYGQIPGLFFITLGLYLLLQFQKQETLPHLIGGAIAIGVACLIRNNFLILVIAILILTTLQAFKLGRIKLLLVPLATMVGVFLLSFGLTTYYSAQTGQAISKGVPKAAFVNMGLTPIPQAPGKNGTYTSYTVLMFAETGYNFEVATERAKTDLENTKQNLFKDPKLARDFFYAKIRATWTDPLFQSIWSGPSLWNDPVFHTYWATTDRTLPEFTSEFWKNIYSNSPQYKLVYTICLPVLFVIYCLATLGAFFQFKKSATANPMELYPLLFLLGGFLFHLFWETKSQYVFYYIPLLLPIAAYALVHIKLPTVKIDRKNWPFQTSPVGKRHAK